MSTPPSIKLIVHTLIAIPFLVACVGKFQEAGLESTALGPNDTIVLEMVGGGSIGFTDADGNGMGMGTSGEESLSFSITNERPVSGGDARPSFTALFVRPRTDADKPGFTIHLGADYCVRDSNDAALWNFADAVDHRKFYQGRIKASGTGEFLLDQNDPIRVGGQLVGVRVNREDGTSQYYNLNQLQNLITYENLPGMFACRSKKTMLISKAVNSPINFKVTRAVIEAEAIPTEEEEARGEEPRGEETDGEDKTTVASAGEGSADHTVGGDPRAPSNIDAQEIPSTALGGSGCTLISTGNFLTAWGGNWLWVLALVGAPWLSRRKKA